MIESLNDRARNSACSRNEVVRNLVRDGLEIVAGNQQPVKA